jgi:4a-hydroxytetrahydrobiopterin dehydratase
VTELTKKRCVPCEGGIPKLNEEGVELFLKQVQGWEAREDRLYKTFQFKDFMEAMGFLNRMAEVAEAEGHHPDFYVHYNRVDITLWTHAAEGLTENDFILAAKIDTL